MTFLQKKTPLPMNLKINERCPFLLIFSITKKGYFFFFFFDNIYEQIPRRSHFLEMGKEDLSKDKWRRQREGLTDISLGKSNRED